MAVTSVQPYGDLTFDADGDPDPAQRDALLAQIRGLTDLVIFSHGWNNDISTADELYDRFLAPFPGLLASTPEVRFGYAGVHWPSMRFSDEPIPDFPRAALLAEGGAGLESSAVGGPAGGEPGVEGAASGGPTAGDRIVLDPATVAALGRVFPGRATEIGRIAELLAERPEAPERLDEFAVLVRTLTGVGPEAAGGSPGEDPAASPATGSATAPAASPATPATSTASFAADLGGAVGADPVILTGDTLATCQALADALEEAGSEVAPAEGGPALFGGLGKRVWDGAHELLRQTTYYAMKRRAGTVGQLGLGPVLGLLIHRAPELRIHLIGHSFGARLVSFALRGLPPHTRVASVTLLQGAFSHYAFSGPLPFDAKGGALHGMQQRVSGPLVACHSSHDQALGLLYPVASRFAGADESLLGIGDRWGALGHDGFQSLDGVPSMALAAALNGPFPQGGCVSVDASAVVCSGGPPSGAHSDICHEELARLVLLAAGRIPA